MAQQTPPFALQNGSHSAALFRQAVSSLLYQAGPLDPQSYVVSAQATPNMSVLVNGGQLWLDGTQAANISGVPFSTQASYFALNDAAVTLTIAAANATNPRIDVVYVAVADQAYSGVTNNVVLGVQTGTAASSPSPPALPNNAIGVAQVRVNANVTSIVAGNITPLVTGTSTGIGIVAGTTIPCTSTTRPTSSVVRMGQGIFETDTGLARFWNGSSWVSVGNALPVTSSTHPSSPPTGATIYETDTGAFGVFDGTAWRMWDTTWQSYTPTLGVGVVVGTGGINKGIYMRQGKQVTLSIAFSFGSAGQNFGTVGSAWTWSLPAGMTFGTYNTSVTQCVMLAQLGGSSGSFLGTTTLTDTTHFLVEYQTSASAVTSMQNGSPGNTSATFANISGVISIA